MRNPRIFRSLLTCLLTVGLFHSTSEADDLWPATLAGTSQLSLDEPLDVVMVRGISRFAEAELRRSAERRRLNWPVEKPGTKAFGEWADQQRDILRTIIGAVDERVPPVLAIVADSGLRAKPQAAGGVEVQHVQWSVFEGVSAEGIMLIPAGDVAGYAVAVPDASWTPEMFCGLADGVPAESQLPRRLAARGIVVLVPMLISRDDTFSGHPDIQYTNMPHREFVYRPAFEMGRSIVGFEVQKVLAAVDLLEQMAKAAGRDGEVGVCGVGDGGQLAMYAAALDARIAPTLVCGYFQQREQVWQEPLDRNIWNQLASLGDAEIAALAAPGELLIEASAAPAFDGPLPARDGRPDNAGPGTIGTPSLASVRTEFARLQELTTPQQVTLVETDGGTGPAGSTEAFTRFATIVARQEGGLVEERSLKSNTATVDVQQREERQLHELIRFTQRLLHSSDKVRAKLWSEADGSSVDAWVASTQKYRELIHDEMIGRLPVPPADLSPRTRKIIDEPTHVGYEVVLDVIPGDDAEDGDGQVIAGGILLLPKDLKEGERRPVVVCQHGLEGVPMDTVTTDQSQQAWQYYKGFSTELARRGFIVYAPQNPYRGRHDFRVLQRKSNPLGRSLFSYIIEQHRKTLHWLGSLPGVDADRIGFYGLSYGGKTAVRVPPLLAKDGDESQPIYCLSICSADFDEWVLKNASTEDRYSYVYTGEYEIFEWNMGHVANYAELASLMIPRPFMVERGHDDGVAPDEWVAWEYAKVRRRYVKLGLADQTEIEFFDGPHTINGDGTYAFLHRHLDWPKR